MGSIASCVRRVLLVSTLTFHCVLSVAIAAEVELTVSAPESTVTTGTEAVLWLNAMNASTQNVHYTFPPEIRLHLRSSQSDVEVPAELRGQSGTTPVEIRAGTFARGEYRFRVPEMAPGEVTLEVPQVRSARLVFEVGNVPAPTEPASKKGMLYFLQGRKHGEHAGEYDPDEFFKQHIFGYEPFYFIAGTKSPNGKFQISFKYRLVNDLGWLAEKAPWMSGFHVGYSQTSLWDWNAPSAPFFDSSYRPEFLYSWDRLVGGRPTNWFRLDLQGGLQHESNGKGGGDSRSMNTVYFRPRFTFGPDTWPQLTITPRVWTYLGDLSDNPDIKDYRGYVDLRVAFGWKRGLQISTLGRMGDDWDHGSITVDATYPLMQPPYGSFSIYLMAQYFNGYGESLLGYKEKSEQFRVGISLYR